MWRPIRRSMESAKGKAITAITAAHNKTPDSLLRSSWARLPKENRYTGGDVHFGRAYTRRSGPKNLDSPVSVISARMGDGIAREDGDDDGKKAEKESRRGVQGTGGTGGDSRRRWPRSPSSSRCIAPDKRVGPLLPLLISL